MAGTTISDLGKVFGSNTKTVQGTVKNQNNSVKKADFHTMMKQSGENRTLQFMSQSETSNTETAANFTGKEKKTATDDYQKYRYKDNAITSENSKPLSGDDIIEQVDRFAENVKEILKEELNVTDDAIEAAMQTLGLQFQDLLNQNNLANLVAKLTGAESVQKLLCSEMFVNVLQRVGEEQNNVLDMLGMNPEEFQTALQKAIDEKVPESPVTDSENGEIQSPQEETNSSDLLQQEAVSEAESIKTDAVRQSSAVETFSAEQPDANEKTVELRTEIPSETTAQESLQDMRTVSENTSDESMNQSTEQGHSDETAGRFKFANETTPASNHEAAFIPQNRVEEIFSTVETVETLPESMNTQDVIDQIVESARVTLTEDHTTMELQLNPENLGKIILKVTEQDGMVTAKILTQNAIVKEALEAQVVELRQNLEQSGVKVEAVEVTVASHEFEKNLEQNAEGEKQQGEQQEKQKEGLRRLNLNDLSELSGVMSEEETLVAKMMAEQGNSVDYTA